MLVLTKRFLLFPMFCSSWAYQMIPRCITLHLFLALELYLQKVLEINSSDFVTSLALLCFRYDEQNFLSILGFFDLDSPKLDWLGCRVFESSVKWIPYRCFDFIACWVQTGSSLITLEDNMRSLLVELYHTPSQFDCLFLI